MSQAEPPVAPPRPCPDCGAPNPPEVARCVECNHPLDVPDARRESSVAPVRPERSERPERVGPNVTSWGYQPGRPSAGGTSMPSWLWAGVGLLALVGVLVTAIQIARAPAPIAIPGGSKAQLASAESLRVLLRADSTLAGPNIAFGNLFYDTGNFGEAVPYYHRALRTDSTLTDVRVDLGVAYHNGGDMESARRELEQATRQDPTHAVAQFDLAVVYQSMGLKDQARERYLKARELEHPEEMGRVIDQLLDRLDHPGNGNALPPGHPDIGGGGGTP
ncbi:MAG: tetratricopeptide repeat protein [Candidatus Eisenbacteria bacterium]